MSALRLQLLSPRVLEMFLSSRSLAAGQASVELIFLDGRC